MKHEGPGFFSALPDAPLAMPTQTLERPRAHLFGRLRRAMLAAFPRLTA
jgi:hypothetical protein